MLEININKIIKSYCFDRILDEFSLDIKTGEIKRYEFENGVHATENSILTNLSDNDKEALKYLTEFRHSHPSGSILPSVTDINQLQQIMDYQYMY